MRTATLLDIKRSIMRKRLNPEDAGEVVVTWGSRSLPEPKEPQIKQADPVAWITTDVISGKIRIPLTTITWSADGVLVTLQNSKEKYIYLIDPDSYDFEREAYLMAWPD
jgi:hypothetical protein